MYRGLGFRGEELRNIGASIRPGSWEKRLEYRGLKGIYRGFLGLKGICRGFRV